MALSEEDRARARQVAASMPPFGEKQRDELALLLRPAVIAVRQARRPTKGTATTRRHGHHA